jgi:Sec7-like guanine-nucleotide exchange factor
MADDIGDMKAKELRFEDVIRRHLDRILASPDSVTFIHNISKFQAVFAGLLDDKTEKDFNKIMKKEENELKRWAGITNLGQTPPYSKEDIRERTATNILKLLINYANDKGWLLEKVSRDEVWELPEDIDEVEEQDKSKE